MTPCAGKNTENTIVMKSNRARRSLRRRTSDPPGTADAHAFATRRNHYERTYACRRRVGTITYFCHGNVYVHTTLFPTFPAGGLQRTGGEDPSRKQNRVPVFFPISPHVTASSALQQCYTAPVYRISKVAACMCACVRACVRACQYVVRKRAP